MSDKSHLTLERMQSFVRVAERGSFSLVARESGVGQSTVTRHVHELEQAVGASLLSRTTRRVALTDEGSRFYADAVEILRLVDKAQDDARIRTKTVSGTVRLSCTAALGVMQVSRILFAFQDAHPDIEIDFSLTDERIDLVKEGFDIAIRLGSLTDSTMKRRSLGHSRRVLVAAPAYLSKRGRPKHPDELPSYEGIRMSNVSGSDTLHMKHPGGEHSVTSFGGRLRIDHGLAAREALVAGRGIAPAHHWLVDDLLADGSLEVLLPDWDLPRIPLNMLVIPERARVARVRLLVDELADTIRRLPGISA